MKKTIVTTLYVIVTGYFELLSLPVCAQNPVVLENRRPGTRDWIISKVRADTCRLTKPYSAAYFCRQEDIEGYCSKTSVMAGDTLQVFVSTRPASSFTVDIYRMGYYGGKGARKMRSIGPLNGLPQATPPDGEKNLRNCEWAKTFNIIIPDDWVSGVYLGKMTALGSGMQSYIVFVLKDNRKTDFLFQCSDFTWQSYNRWPEWRSGYDWYFANGDHNPWNSDAGPEISFNRPYTFYFNGLPIGLGDPRLLGSGEFLLWEFPLAYWMESRGYDVSYISNMDTHAHPRELLRARGFLSVGHDEYWTREMYDNVSAARDAGVNLLFLSGNSVSGIAYLKPDPNQVPGRVMGRIERFRDEHQLMGAKSYGVGLGDWTCTAPEHWLFRGTRLKKGDFIKDLVGWEYHGFPVGDRSGLEVLATGPMIATEDSALYAATIYHASKGNFVFNAGTCWWSMLLSAPPLFPETLNPYGAYGGHPVDFRKGDVRVQKMTENLFKRVIDH